MPLPARSAPSEFGWYDRISRMIVFLVGVRARCARPCLFGIPAAVPSGDAGARSAHLQFLDVIPLLPQRRFEP
jgi:hypothetical protein